MSTRPPLPLLLMLLAVSACSTPGGGSPTGRQALPLGGPNGASVVGQNGATVVGQNGAAVVGQNGAAVVGIPESTRGSEIALPGSLGSLTGTLLAAPASVIGPTEVALAPWRLLALAEAPVAGAEVRLVDAAGQALLDEVATTDEAGRFRLPAPPEGAEALLRAHFDAGGATVEYAALVTAGEAVVVDTATTLLAARWREARQAGYGPRGSQQAVLARLREVLEPGAVPFLRPNSPDAADAFDQLVGDDATLQALAEEGLRRPARAWRVTAWHSEDTLRARAVLPVDRRLRAGEVGVLAVDPAGTLHLVVEGSGQPRVERLTATGRRLEPLLLPAGGQGPYALAFSPGGTLHLLGRDGQGRLTSHRLASAGFERLATGRLAFDAPAGTAPGIAATDDGVVYLADSARHVVWRLAAGGDGATVHAGRLGQPGDRDGARADALLDAPQALAVAPDGGLVVADTGNGRIRRLGRDGRVVTVAGGSAGDPLRLGRGRQARLGEPAGLAVGPDGTIFATDRRGRRVVRVSPDGSVFVVAGGGLAGSQNGVGREARFEAPAHLSRDAEGHLYVADVAADGQVIGLRRLATEGPAR
ncbi:MAG: hypothetical protein VKS61_08870 [Candidatus Sericytochromatia bacterium]|nr:hypothetical protein [Candidatus Sericytochromatia bacterium]